MFWICLDKEIILKFMSPGFLYFLNGCHKILNYVSVCHDINTEQHWCVGLEQKVPHYSLPGSHLFTL